MSSYTASFVFKGQPKNRYQLRRQLVQFRKDFLEHEVPIDFTGDELPGELPRIVVDFFIQKGYLTENYQPTELALANDYIRLNDGSRFFNQLDQQPKLLCKGRFLLYLKKHYQDDITNLVNKYMNDTANH